MFWISLGAGFAAGALLGLGAAALLTVCVYMNRRR